jgi:hypothetical protein
MQHRMHNDRRWSAWARRMCLLAGLGLISTAWGQRGDLAWEFSDPAGTFLPGTVGAVPESRWIGTLGESVTTGEGALRLKSVGRDKAVAHLPLGDLAQAESLWLVVRLESWKFGGTGGREFAIGFSERIEPHRAVVQAGFRGSRARGLFVTGEALRSEEGAVNTKAFKLGPGSAQAPLVIALEYRPRTREFNLYQADQGGAFTLLGSGKTSPKRKAKFAHLYLKGELGAAAGEQVDIGALALVRRQIATP